MRFAMTARTIATTKKEGRPISDMTARNIEKVTKYRQNGEQELRQMVKEMSKLGIRDRDDSVTIRRPRDLKISKEEDEN